MSRSPAAVGTAFSIRRLRTLILIALVAGVAAVTGVLFTLVHSLSEQFGPQLEADLEWRALRGAQELSKTTDLGLAVSDPALVLESFGAYAESSDVLAILAFDARSKLIASHGSISSIAPVFAAKPGTIVHGPGYVASWATAVIEGVEVGKVAVVVSTQRLIDAQAMLSRVSYTSLISGIVGALLGALVILYFTRQVSIRDRQLGDHARDLEYEVEARVRELDDRNRGMRLVLDNVAQGFITIDLGGVMARERSAIVARWFGEARAGATFTGLLAAHAPDLAAWFELGLDSLREGHLPPDLCLHQMPRRFTAGPRTFDIAYSPIVRAGKAERILLILSDVTEDLVHERTERAQRELVAVCQQVAADRPGFEEFLDDASALVASLAAPGDPLTERRTLHTLKGNCATYGFESFPALCHAVETELAETTGPMAGAQRKAIAEAWREVTAQMVRLLGDRRRQVVEIELSELAHVVELAELGESSSELTAALTAWSHEPVARRFERLAKYGASLANRLGKGDVAVWIADDGIRLHTSRWAGFWGAMVHAVRNAVDHGIDDPDVRAAAGKPARPNLWFAASRTSEGLTISIADDGGGIAWDDVRARARACRLPAESESELEQALFADGFSTREEASDVSGRGVGMAALRVAVAALGGTIELESRARKGTTLLCRFPEAESHHLPLRAATQPLSRLA
jgi:two-component system chemotaxis sensor kinase CheA